MQYFGEPEGWIKIQMMSKNLQWYYTLKCLIRDLLSNVFVSPKFWLAKGFDLSRGRGNEMSTNIVWYLYSFRALFVLYEAVLDNKIRYFVTKGWVPSKLPCEQSLLLLCRKLAGYGQFDKLSEWLCLPGLTSCRKVLLVKLFSSKQN